MLKYSNNFYLLSLQIEVIRGRIIRDETSQSVKSILDDYDDNDIIWAECIEIYILFHRLFQIYVIFFIESTTIKDILS